MTKRRRTRRPPPPHPPSGSSPGVVVPPTLSPAAHPPVRPSTGSGRESTIDGLSANTRVGLVTTGRLDDHLGALTAAIAQRQRHRVRAASNQAAALLDVGDRVRMSSSIRPLYLRGATGTIVGWSGQSAVVRLDVPTRGAVAGEVRCPPLGLSVIPG